MGKRILLAGGSGEVGSRLVENLIAQNSISEIHLINRRPLVYQYEKVTQHTVDFKQLGNTGINEKFDLAYCCLGTTIKKAGSEAAFEEVDLTFVREFSQLAKQTHCQHLVVISCVGADPKSAGLYLKTKGLMEAALADQNWKKLSVFRPGLLMGKRQEFRLVEWVSGLLMKIINPLFIGPLYKYRGIQMDTVANAMANIDSRGLSGTVILGNQEINALNGH